MPNDELEKLKPENTNVEKFNKNTFWTLFVGVIVLILWVLLFTIGTNVDSKYYRAGISFHYGGLSDWIMTVISFTLTNVILLSFFSGFLGGACSKVIITEGFTVSEKELKKRGHDSVLYENPMISAFRGIFLFIGILTLQYVSSFSDLSSVNTNIETKKQKDISASYQAILDSVKDSASRDKIIAVMGKEQNLVNDSTAFFVSKILELKDNLCHSPKNENTNKLKLQIIELRKKVQLPDNADIPGLSSSSYFRFAVIVSLLAFICGYDPKRFNVILGMIPILSKTENPTDAVKPDKPEKKATPKSQTDRGSGAE